MSDIFTEFYEAIDAFVNKDENLPLKFGTGAYSVPFRGTLFGKKFTKDVVDLLLNPSYEIDVLWIGSNPYKKESLDKIKDALISIKAKRNITTTSDYSDFQAQMSSGCFSQVNTDLSIGWDPINIPERGWCFYSKLIEAVCLDRNRTLMANFLPWGSGTFKAFGRTLNQYSIGQDLCNRALDFSDELNYSLIKTLKPKLVIVPRSLCVPKLRQSHLYPTTKIQSMFLGQKLRYRYYLEKAKVDDYEFTKFVVPHPSWVPRMGKISEKQQKQLIAELGKYVSGNYLH